MIRGATVLAVVMARGGSKGLRRKNLRELGGKPLLAWTIEAALQSTYIDRLILSSEDPEIIAVARALRCEAPFVRPGRLAQDDTAAIDVVRHAMGEVERHDYLVLLQPTSPLRTSSDIDACIELCHASAAPCAVTITEVSKSPHWMYTLGADRRLEPVMGGARPVRRQDAPTCYALNGAVFMARWEWLERHDDFVGEGGVGYVMPKERAVDVDDELDLKIAAALLASPGPAG